jgi:hypothetical protein
MRFFDILAKTIAREPLGSATKRSKLGQKGAPNAFGVAFRFLLSALCFFATHVNVNA